MKPICRTIKLRRSALVGSLTLFLLVASCSYCAAQDFAFSGKRKKDQIGFTLIKNIIVIRVYLNDKGPFNFVLDTGVGQLLITDPSIMDSLKLQRFRTIKISGYGSGKDLEAYISYPMAVTVGKAKAPHLAAAVLKEDIFDLSNYLGIKIDGLIGFPLFNSFLVKINYANKVVHLYNHNSLKLIKGEPIALEIHNGKPYVSIDISTNADTTPVKLILDNGASHALSLESIDGKPFPLPEKHIQANLGVGLSGRIDGRIGRVTSLKLGSFIFKEVLTSYPDYEDVGSKTIKKDRNGNLGADLLSHFNVTLDYRHSVMYLKKNRYYNKPFNHDMSGLEIFIDQEKTKGYFIARVEPNSPGDLCGVQADDQVISINFKPISNFSLDEITSLFKSKEGRHIILEVFRKGETLFKIFDLKQRI